MPVPRGAHDAFATRPDATLGAAAIERFQTFGTEGAPFTPCPYVWLARTGDDERVRIVRAGIERMHELDRQVVELGPTVLGERFPTLRTDDVAVAGMSTGAGFVDTGRYTAWLADRARAEGGTIRGETPVEVDPEKYDRDANPGFAADLAIRVAHRLPDYALAGHRPASRRRDSRRRGHHGVRPKPVRR